MVDPSQGRRLGRGATDVVDPSWLTLPRGGTQEEVLLQQTIPSNHKAVLPKGSTTHLLQQSPFLKGVPATEAALTVFPDNPSRKTTNPALGVNSRS